MFTIPLILFNLAFILIAAVCSYIVPNLYLHYTQPTQTMSRLFFVTLEDSVETAESVTFTKQAEAIRRRIFSNGKFLNNYEVIFL